MIIFILIHKNLRKTINTIKIAIKNEDVKKIYLILSEQTLINDKELITLINKYKSLILLHKHNRKGIKGAWLQCLKVAIEKNSDFIIFENDIVPSNFFLNLQNYAFHFIKMKKSFLVLLVIAQKVILIFLIDLT